MNPADWASSGSARIWRVKAVRVEIMKKGKVWGRGEKS